MDESNVRKYGAILGINQFRPKTRNGWMEAKCPLAPFTHEKGYDKSPSFAILANDAGPSAYKCQACGHKGSMSGLFFKMFAYTKNEEYQRHGREVEVLEASAFSQALPGWDEEEAAKARLNRVILNKGTEYAKYPLATHHRRTLDYMKSRGIDFATVMTMGLRYHYAEDRVMFPVIDRNNELRGFTGRAMYKNPSMKAKDFAGLNKIELFLNEHRVWRLARERKIRFVVVVEGLLDCAAVIQAGYPGVLCLLGAELTVPKMEKLVDLNLPIIWMVDNDEGGKAFLYGKKIDRESEEREAFKGALYLMRMHVPQMLVKYPQGVDDPGSATPEQIRRMVEKAKLVY